jgi:hypothetical protein
MQDQTSLNPFAGAELRKGHTIESILKNQQSRFKTFPYEYKISAISLHPDNETKTIFRKSESFIDFLSKLGGIAKVITSGLGFVVALFSSDNYTQ